TDDAIYMLFDMQGMNNRDAMVSMLNDWRGACGNFGSRPGGMDAWAAAFVLDADNDGVTRRRDDLFAWLADKNMIDAAPAGNGAGLWKQASGYAMGCFVVHGPGVETGAIEDHWIPIARAAVPRRLQEAQTFVATHTSEGDEVTKPGRANKAALTIAGQIESPG